MTTMETLFDEFESGVARMRGIYDQWENLRKAQQAYIAELEAERDALRASFQEAEQINEGVVRRLSAKRDVLQAQLDSMTWEFQGWPDSPTFSRRRVGPWVEVPY